MAEDGLGGLQPELVSNHLGLRVPQLVRRPVDETCRPEFRDSVGRVNPRRRLLSDPVGHGRMVGVRRVMVPDVLQVRLRLAIRGRLYDETRPRAYILGNEIPIKVESLIHWIPK